MAKLKENSVIMKSTGDEIIGTNVDLEKALSNKVNISDYPIERKDFTPTLLEGQDVSGNHSYIKRQGEYVTFGDVVIFYVANSFE